MLKKDSGIAVILIVVVIIVVAIIAILSSSVLHKEKTPGSLSLPFSKTTPADSESGSNIIYDENGITISYVWPGGQKNIANEEAEIRVTNNSTVALEITNPFITISASNKVYEAASEGWESFDSERNRKLIDKIVIYKSVPEAPVMLAAGKYGRLHYHFLFDDAYAQSTKHTANIKFDLNIGGEVITVADTIERTVEPSDSYESDAENPVSDYFKDPGTDAGH